MTVEGTSLAAESEFHSSPTQRADDQLRRPRAVTTAAVIAVAYGLVSLGLSAFLGRFLWRYASSADALHATKLLVWFGASLGLAVLMLAGAAGAWLGTQRLLLMLSPLYAVLFWIVQVDSFNTLARRPPDLIPVTSIMAAALAALTLPLTLLLLTKSSRRFCTTRRAGATHRWPGALLGVTGLALFVVGVRLYANVNHAFLLVIVAGLVMMVGGTVSAINIGRAVKRGEP